MHQLLFDLESAEKKKEEWLKQRHGKFTASLIGKLLSKGTGSDLFGVGARTYIREVAIEKLTHVADKTYLDRVRALKHGKMSEPLAFADYVEYTGNSDMVYCGTESPLFLVYEGIDEKDSGGSPDAIMGEGEEIFLGAEFKCPLNPEVHLDYMRMNHQLDLLAYNVEYYAQIQFNMMCTKAKRWHFVSYCDAFLNPKLHRKILDIRPDMQMQTNLKLRVRQAIRERDKYIESVLKLAA